MTVRRECPSFFFKRAIPDHHGFLLAPAGEKRGEEKKKERDMEEYCTPPTLTRKKEPFFYVGCASKRRRGGGGEKGGEEKIPRPFPSFMDDAGPIGDRRVGRGEKRGGKREEKKKVEPTDLPRFGEGRRAQ